MRSIFLALLLPYLALSASAQSPASILKKAEKAMGGAKAITASRAWTRTGTVTDPATGAKGRFASHASRPNLFHEVYDLNGVEYESGFNGKSGWERDSRSGLRTLTGDASLAMQAEAVFRNSLWLNYKKEKSKLFAGGKSEVNGKPANIVRLNTAKGVELKLFFDATTGLLVRDEFRSGDKSSAFVYDEFREVAGVKLPYRIRIESGENSLLVELSEIRPEPNIVSSVFDFPQISGEPLPDIAKLLAELQANEDEVEKILDQYSYTQRSTRREIGKYGVARPVGSETYQLSFYKGNRIRRLVEKNGKPLGPREQEDADKDAGKQVEEIEKRLARNERNSRSGTPSDEGRRISIAELLRASNLLNPRRERFRGRDVIVFDFEPNPNFDFKNAKSLLKFFGKTAGVMWIDEKDKQVARLEAYLADSYNIGGGVLAKLKKGASFTLEQERLNDEIWLPSLADINLSVRVLLVKGIDVNQEIRSYDYRKFATEVKDAKVGEPLKN
jgi:outer membrane lipoprotein-sorting protein